MSKIPLIYSGITDLSITTSDQSTGSLGVMAISNASVQGTLAPSPQTLKVNKSFSKIVVIENGNEKIVLPSVSSVEELREQLQVTCQELSALKKDHRKLINEHNKIVKELNSIHTELKKKVSIRHGI